MPIVKEVIYRDPRRFINSTDGQEYILADIYKGSGFKKAVPANPKNMKKNRRKFKRFHLSSRPRVNQLGSRILEKLKNVYNLKNSKFKQKDTKLSQKQIFNLQSLPVPPSQGIDANFLNEKINAQKGDFERQLNEQKNASINKENLPIKIAPKVPVEELKAEPEEFGSKKEKRKYTQNKKFLKKELFDLADSIGHKFFPSEYETISKMSADSLATYIKNIRSKGESKITPYKQSAKGDPETKEDEKEDDEPTYNDQIETILWPWRRIIGFVGVCATDELAEFLENITNLENWCLVMNTDKSTGTGKHWVCICGKNGTIAYYDPFGRPPLKGIQIIITKFANESYNYVPKFKVNLVKNQDIDSSNCGIYVIRFILLFMAMGGSFAHVTGFTQDKKFKDDEDMSIIKRKFDYV